MRVRTICPHPTGHPGDRATGRARSQSASRKLGWADGELAGRAARRRRLGCRAGGGIDLGEGPPNDATFVTPPARLSSDPNSYWYHVYSKARTMTAANHSLADQRADYLRFAAAAVAILTW